MKKTEKQILIFGGTTEGRMAAERLLAEGVLCTVCVATEYGSEVMEPHPLLTVHVGRMDRMEMVDMMGGEVYACVIDATHPHRRDAPACAEGDGGDPGCLPEDPAAIPAGGKRFIGGGSFRAEQAERAARRKLCCVLFMER